jgi:hypothetical protein
MKREPAPHAFLAGPDYHGLDADGMASDARADSPHNAEPARTLRWGAGGSALCGWCGGSYMVTPHARQYHVR